MNTFMGFFLIHFKWVAEHLPNLNLLLLMFSTLHEVIVDYCNIGEYIFHFWVVT